MKKTVRIMAWHNVYWISSKIIVKVDATSTIDNEYFNCNGLDRRSLAILKIFGKNVFL